MLAENILPSPERNALIQRYRYGLDVAEAAREMNVNKRSFSRYISVALRKIRSFVSDEQANKYKH
ncbi:sigma factor-like helix-turn-helix DNA-binding protein [Planctomycetota bacterium]